MKVVINRSSCYFRGYTYFRLSYAILKKYYKVKGIPIYRYYRRDNGLFIRLKDDEPDRTNDWYFDADPIDNETFLGLDFIVDHKILMSEIPRNDPDLIKVIEENKEDADHRLSTLKIVEIPDNELWHIAERNGLERVVCESRSYW